MPKSAQSAFFRAHSSESYSDWIKMSEHFSERIKKDVKWNQLNLLNEFDSKKIDGHRLVKWRPLRSKDAIEARNHCIQVVRKDNR